MIDLNEKRPLSLWRLLLPIFILVPVIGGYLLYQWYTGRAGGGARTAQIFAWFADNGLHQEKMMQAGEQCADAPFIFPTDGLAGFLWGDSFRPGHTHQGIDIFAGTAVGVTPIYAAYPGYLRRLPDWVSSVIIRVPDDPLRPGRQIWVYYTHMADAQGNSFIDAAFPQGTSEVFVEAGTLLGYQGNYSGDPFSPVGVHLHISIVKDDPLGTFQNEIDINNTYDPSPYFGMALNGYSNRSDIPTCAGVNHDQ